MFYQQLSKFIVGLGATKCIYATIVISKQSKEIAVRVKEILNNYELCLADIEVMLNGETRSAPTLCVTDGHEVIPLNTPDGRPIQMNKDNAIQLGDGKWV